MYYFDESYVLLKNCEDCVEHSIKRYVSSNEEKEEMDTKHEEPRQDLPQEMRFIKNHPKNHILIGLLKGVTSLSFCRNVCANLAFTSQIAPKPFKEVEKEE